MRLTRLVRKWEDKTNKHLEIDQQVRVLWVSRMRGGFLKLVDPHIFLAIEDYQCISCVCGRHEQQRFPASSLTADMRLLRHEPEVDLARAILRYRDSRVIAGCVFCLCVPTARIVESTMLSN